MQVNFCNPEHSNTIQYFISQINTAICEECHSKFLREGHECTSINSMGNSYMCDIKSLKNKGETLYDSINSNQAKLTLNCEKQIESIVSCFESYIAEVIKIKELIISETKELQKKFMTSIDTEFLDQKSKLKLLIDDLKSHIQNLENSISASNKNELIAQIGMVDISKKLTEIEGFQSAIDTKFTTKIPDLSYQIDKRNIQRDDIMSHVGIKKITSEAIEIQNPVTIIKPPTPQNIQLSEPVEVKPLPAKITIRTFLHYFQPNKLYLFDISRNKKFAIDTPSLESFPLKHFPSILIQEYIFLCGGVSSDSTNIRSTFTFDLSNLEFVQRKSMPIGRSKHALAVIGSTFVYLIGGVRNKSAIRECCKYDLETDKWITVPSLNDENCLMTAFTFKNRLVYSIGGMNNYQNGFSALIERLDIAKEDEGWSRVDFKTNGWSARYAMNSCQLSEQYFLLFGGANISLQNHCFLYDAESDTLMFISRMLQGSKFEVQHSQPILFKDIVYSIDDEKNLHMFHVRTNSWTITKWNQWKPISIKGPQYLNTNQGINNQ